MSSARVCVVKAQIHAGGRGKAGGVKVCKTPDEAREFARGLLGKTLVTHQTGPAGREVRRVLVEQGCDIARELYLGMVIDRGRGWPTLMASSEGGVEIEEVAARSPEKILREPIDPAVGIQAFQATQDRLRARAAEGVDQQGGGVHQRPLSRLRRVRLLARRDQPAGADEVGRSAGARRQDGIRRQCPLPPPRRPRAARPQRRRSASEVEASKHDLSYISLDGNIGCMVNGAGLAMSTMDIIKQNGGEPANFLDVGGGATTEKVTAAFKILLSDPHVQAVLVNIFGGIMKCDVIATGVVEAARQIQLKIPLVVRLEGTNVELGQRILAESKLDIVSASNMADAARKVVAAARGA